MKRLIQQAEAGVPLGLVEIAELFTAEGGDQQALYDAADRVRCRRMGDGVHLRGIIEFSNICQSDCLYCGIRRSNETVQRYCMEPDEIVAAAEAAWHLGYGTVVLQSGEALALSSERLADVVRRIKAATPLAVTLSVGERSYAEYELWREAGADRYLMRHETADPALFADLRPRHTLNERIQCLLDLRSLGYQIGSGFMVGLPGQTPDSLAADVDLLRDLQVEMAGIGPFIPSPGTPLAMDTGGTLDMTLKAVAITRLCLPNAHLPATTAVGSIHPRGRQLALHCGANVIMPNVTPQAYREQYQLYPNKICLKEEPRHCALCVTALVCGGGRHVAEGPGHSPHQGPWQSA